MSVKTFAIIIRKPAALFYSFISQCTPFRPPPLLSLSRTLVTVNNWLDNNRPPKRNEDKKQRYQCSTSRRLAISERRASSSSSCSSSYYCSGCACSRSCWVIFHLHPTPFSISAIQMFEFVPPECMYRFCCCQKDIASQMQ